MDETPMPDGMSHYERQRWQQIQEWKAHASAQSKLHLPESARKALGTASAKVAEAWESVPGNDKVEAWIATAVNGSFHMAIDGLSKTIREPKVTSRVEKHARQSVSTYADIRQLDLKPIDRAVPSQKLLRSGAAAGHGAVAGFVAGGSVAAGAASGGMGALPATGLVAGAAVLDAGALVGSMLHASAFIGAHHGFNPAIPQEHAMLMTMLRAGVAKEGGKVAAMMRVRELSLMLAAKAPLAQLTQHQLFNLMKKLYAALLLKTAKRNIAKGLPVAGIVLGGGVNYASMRSLVEAAEHLYPERFLLNKYSGEPDSVVTMEQFESVLEPEVDDRDADLVDRIVELPAPDDSGRDQSEPGSSNA